MHRTNTSYAIRKGTLRCDLHLVVVIIRSASPASIDASVEPGSERSSRGRAQATEGRTCYLGEVAVPQGPIDVVGPICAASHVRNPRLGCGGSS